MGYIKCREKTKWLRGSTVIEMSYIIPLFLGLFVIIIHAVFYYHDKAVLNGVAGETAVLGAQAANELLAARREGTEYDLEDFFSERAEGRLIYMKDISVTVTENDTEVIVYASAQRNIMKLAVRQSARIARPEKKLRMTTGVR